MAKLHRSSRKRRTREHIIADLSANHVERHLLMCGYSAEHVRHDYGVDLLLFTYDDLGHVEPGLVYLQLKATDKLRRVAKRSTIAVRLERRDLVAWLRQIDPVILIQYDARREVAYRLYVQEHFRNRPRFSLDRVGETVTVHIPIQNIVDSTAIREFARFKEQTLLHPFGEEKHNDE